LTPKAVYLKNFEKISTPHNGAMDCRAGAGKKNAPGGCIFLEKFRLA
jgi:hypothetical protein